MKGKLLTHALRATAALGLAASVPATASAADLDVLKVSGYIRHALQWNLSNVNETPQNDRWDLNMSRTTVRFDMVAELPTVTFVAIARASREVETNYLQRLDALKDATNIAFGGVGSTDLVDEYYNEEELREFYAEFDVTDRISMRLGRQQVAFGETDFFQANDLLHGFDFTWRSFLEAENEELRKPLTMANVTIQVPELNGKLQLIYGPGSFNSPGWIGTELDIFGGRFSGQPNKGFSFLDAAITPYNYQHPEGSTEDDDFWAVRWSGYSFDVNYSFMYLRHFNPDPIVIANPNNPFYTLFDGGSGADVAGILASEVPFDGSSCAPNAAFGVCFGETAYTTVNTFGGTASYYDAWTDVVYSTELAYTVDKPFQAGRFCGFCQFAAGFVGLQRIVKKDQLSLMIRADKLLYLSEWLGTHRASFFSVQVFNKWLPDFEKSDELTVGPGFGQPKKRWETVVTAILAMNYLNDRINPSLAAGYDVSYGSAFVIPSVNIVQGDTWRLLIEADIFFANDDRKGHPLAPANMVENGFNEQEDNIFGSFNQNNQLYIRLTRQF